MKKMTSTKFNLGHVEILANGQYFVAEGIHPVTKQKYTWHDGSPETVHAKELLLITEEQAQKVVAWFEEKARSLGLEPENKNSSLRPSGAAVSNVLDVSAVLNTKSNAQKPVGLKPYWCINLLKRLDPSCKRKRWISIGMALHHEFRGSHEAFTIWDRWSAKSKTKYVPGETTEQWKSFDRGYSGRPVTGATLLYFSKGKGKINSKAPLKPKKLPPEAYCQKAISVLQENSIRSPWSFRMIIAILQKHLKTGYPRTVKIKDHLLKNGLLIDNSDKNRLCQYTLTENGKLPCLPEKKESRYAV